MKFIHKKQLLPVKLALVGLAALQLTACVPMVFGTAATGAALVHDRRPAGAILDDQGIELRVIHETAKEPFYEKSHIGVTSYDHTVLLVGQVPTPAARAKVQAIVEDIPNVKKLYNELTVGPAIALSTRAHDGFVTTKIKSRFIASNEIDPTRVKVITENGNVYMLGIVSESEANIATREAEQVSGVYRITRLFQYARVEKIPKKQG